MSVNLFFAKSCGEDTDLRREVESQFSFENSSEDFLETPPEFFASKMLA